jgi:hypothetical protein
VLSFAANENIHVGSLGHRRELLAGKQECFGMVGYWKHGKWATYNGNWYLCCDGDWVKYRKKSTSIKC